MAIPAVMKPMDSGPAGPGTERRDDVRKGRLDGFQALNEGQDAGFPQSEKYLSHAPPIPGDVGILEDGERERCRTGSQVGPRPRPPGGGSQEVAGTGHAGDAARPVILVYFLASRVAMKAGSPGLPSLVVTPSSHLVAISGWAATQSRAASRAFISGFSCMVTMMEFIMVTGTT